jgi:hypothetical protein
MLQFFLKTPPFMAFLNFSASENNTTKKKINQKQREQKCLDKTEACG